LDTFFGEYPNMLNYNYSAIKDYIHTFYDPSFGNQGYIKVPVNTTGSVKASSGTLGNLITGQATISKAGGNSGNLTVQGDLIILGTTQINTVITSDLAYVNAYNGAPFKPRDASNPWEPTNWKYIDVSTSYYKIRNDASIALNTNTLAEIVSFIFDTSYGTLGDPFYIRLDPCDNTFSIQTVTDSSTISVSFICTYADASASNSVWKVYDYKIWTGIINNF